MRANAWYRRDLKILISDSQAAHGLVLGFAVSASLY